MITTEKIKTSTFWSNLFKAPAERTDIEDVLLSLPPFEGLNSTHLKHLMKIVHNRVYGSGEYIFFQSDPGIALYIIREGEVKIVKHSESGQETELANFSRGDFFGELALLDDDVRSASAIAVRDSKLAVIFKPDLENFIDKFPKKGNRILKGLAQIIATRLRLLDDEFLSLYHTIQTNEEKQDGRD